MLDKRAYTEAFYIINEMSEELRSKIPNEIIKNIENKMDRTYEFNIENDMEDAELLEDTEKILSVLYTDYLATDEEREVIKNKEKILKEKNKINLPEIKIKEIFTKNKEIKSEQENTNLLTEIPKEKWYTKLLKGFRKFWKTLRNRK